MIYDESTELALICSFSHITQGEVTEAFITGLAVRTGVLAEQHKFDVVTFCFLKTPFEGNGD